MRVTLCVAVGREGWPIGSAFKELGSYVVEINDVEVKAFAVVVVGEGET